MKKFITQILFLFVSMTFAQTTQNVKGVVADKDSDYPIPSAEVSIRINQKVYGAVTDFNGEYIIKNVPVGRINISASYVGYETQSFNNLDLEAGKELVVNFTLSENVSKLDAVVIKTHKKNDQLIFVVGSDYELKAEQINRYAGSLNDVSRMAMNYAGVASNDDSQNSIIVRGNNPSSLLWTMEGVSIPNPNHYSASGSSGGPVSMINTNTLGKSDFLAGAFPANFGNTTSAAFDLQFRTGNKDKYEYVGQIGFAGAELGVEGPFSKKNKASFMINYRYSTLEIFDKMGLDLGLGTAVPKYQDASILLNIPSKKLGKFRIWSIMGTSKIRFLTNEEGGDNLYLDYSSSDLKTYNLSVISGVNNKYFFNNKTSLFTALSFSHLDQRVKMDTLNTITNHYDNLYQDKIFTNYITAKAEVKSKRNVKNTFAVGSEFTLFGIDMFMEIHNPSYYYTNSQKKQAGLSSVYLNWKHKFSDKFSLNTGVRTQYFDLNNQVSIEPRMGWQYKMSKSGKITFAYGLHSNIHQLLAYYSKHKNGSDYEYKNLNLKFSKSNHFVFGYQQDLPGKFQIKTEIYYQYLFDVPVSKDDKTYSILNAGFSAPGGAQVFYKHLLNEGAGENYGVDFTLEHPLDKGFYMLFTGSLYKSIYKAYDKKWRNTAWNGSYMSSLLAGKEFIFNNKSILHFDINLNYSGGRRYIPIDKQASVLAGEAVYDQKHVYEYQLPAYFRTDLKISYKISGKKITQEWQLDLRNVFDRKNIFSQRYNKKKNDIEYTYQTGFLPVMQYRILF